jgi:hypothetical protein
VEGRSAAVRRFQLCGFALHLHQLMLQRVDRTLHGGELEHGDDALRQPNRSLGRERAPIFAPRAQKFALLMQCRKTRTVRAAIQRVTQLERGFVAAAVRVPCSKHAAALVVVEHRKTEPGAKLVTVVGRAARVELLRTVREVDALHDHARGHQHVGITGGPCAHLPTVWGLLRAGPGR